MGVRLSRLRVSLLLSLFFVLSLSLGAYARVVDFRAGVSKTEVTLNSTDQAVTYVVVELLNDEGQIDPAGYQEVDELKVEVASVLGKVEGYEEKVGADDKGVKIAKIVYDDVTGTDLITVTVKESYYTEEGDAVAVRTRVIGTKRFNVVVNPSGNIAKSIKIESLSLKTEPIEDEAGHYDTSGVCTTGCVVEAGRSFVLTLKACKEEPDDDECTLVPSQNSDVTVWLVGICNDSEEGNIACDGKEPKIYELNGTFKNGIATIEVPEGVVTKAGKYYVYATTESTKVNDITKKFEAIEKFNKSDAHPKFEVAVSPRKAMKVVVTAASTFDLDQDGKFWCSENGNGTTLEFVLVDEYGNVADNATGLPTKDKGYLKVKLSGKLTDSTKPFGYEGKVSVNYALTDCNDTFFGPLNDENGTREEKSITISLDASGDAPEVELATDSIDVNYYQNSYDLNGAAFGTANNFAGIGAGVLNNNAITKVISAAYGGGVSNGTELINGLASSGSIVVHLQFYNDTDLLNDVTVDLGNGTNGTINAYDLSLENITKAFDRVCMYYSSSDKYLPRVCAKIVPVLDLRDKAKQKGIKVYKLRSIRYVKGLFGNGNEDIDSVEIKSLIGHNATLRLVAFNKTITTPDDWYGVFANSIYYGNYTARVVDSADNLANSTELTVECEEAKVVDDGNGNVTLVWSDPTKTEDVCVFKSGSLTKELPVTINWASGADHVDIYVPFEYVLTVSKIPVAMQLKREDGTDYHGKLTLKLYVDNPTLIKVYGKDTFESADALNNGDNVTFDENGAATLFVQTFAGTGDVTITVKNDSGTVTGSVTLHIVESKAEVPVEIANVLPNPTSITVNEGNAATVKVKVVDNTGNGIGSQTVTASSSNASIVSVTPETCTTDMDGQCEFTVKGVAAGEATITFVAGGLNATVDVTVNEAVVECGPDNLAACTTEEECTEAGGNWCNGVCQAEECVQPEPVPSEHKAEMNAEVNSGGVSVGEAAADGVVSGDENLSIKVEFPTYAEPVDVYVAFAIPDVGAVFVKSDKTVVPFDGETFVPYAENVTEVPSVDFGSIPVKNPLTGQCMLPAGDYTVCTLVVPAGSSVADFVNDGAGELTCYTFKVECE